MTQLHLIYVVEVQETLAFFRRGSLLWHQSPAAHVPLAALGVLQIAWLKVSQTAKQVVLALQAGVQQHEYY